MPVPDTSPGDTTRYPVLYLLDGHFAFSAPVAASDYMGLVNALGTVIFAGESHTSVGPATVARALRVL